MSESATAALTQRGQWWPMFSLMFFDLAGPLVLYTVLESEGVNTVAALVISGVLPAFGVGLSYVRHGRLDVIGGIVLGGILLSSTLGIATGDSHLVLLEGSVGTAAFACLCLWSLRTSRPLIFLFALEFFGADTPRGREFSEGWGNSLFRHTFHVITAVWGIAYLAQAAVLVVVVETSSTTVALAFSKIMPYAVGVLIFVWMFAYGAGMKRKAVRLGVAGVLDA
jgi:hypothetical protein